jgi:hypothetical protein
MKIEAHNAAAYLKHVKALEELHPLYRSGHDLFITCSRLEAKARRIATEIDSGQRPTSDRVTEGNKIVAQVQKLFPSLQWVEACHNDSRGYAIQFDGKQAAELGMYTDQGECGILAPKF